MKVKNRHLTIILEGLQLRRQQLEGYNPQGLKQIERILRLEKRLAAELDKRIKRAASKRSKKDREKFAKLASEVVALGHELPELRRQSEALQAEHADHS